MREKLIVIGGVVALVGAAWLWVAYHDDDSVRLPEPVATEPRVRLPGER